MKILARDMWTVFRCPSCVVGGFFALFVFGFVSTTLPHINSIKHIINLNMVPLDSKYEAVWFSIINVLSNLNSFQFGLAVISAVLFASSIAIAIYLYRHLPSQGVKSGVGVLGAISSVLGIGCASCGSVILTSILLSFGALSSSYAVSILGLSFSILGVILLLVSNVVLLRKIRAGNVCNTEW